MHSRTFARSVSRRPELATDTQRFVDSCVCSTFSERALAFLSGRPGAAFRKSALLFRNYVPLLTAEAPIEVDEGDAGAMAEVVEFYSSMAEAVGRNLSLPSFLESVARKTRVFFVFSGGRYFRVKMEAPYIVLSALSQPMSTRWTTTDAIPATAELPYGYRTGREIFRVGEAVQGAAQMLMARGPEMLARRAENLAVSRLAALATGSVGGAAIAAGAMASVLGWKTVFALVFGFASGCVTTLSVVAYRRFVSGV